MHTYEARKPEVFCSQAMCCPSHAQRPIRPSDSGADCDLCKCYSIHTLFDVTKTRSIVPHCRNVNECSIVFREGQEDRLRPAALAAGSGGLCMSGYWTPYCRAPRAQIHRVLQLLCEVCIPGHPAIKPVRSQTYAHSRCKSHPCDNRFHDCG